MREQGKMGRIADGWGRDDLTLWKPNSTVKFLFYTTPRAQHRRFLRNQPLYLCLTDLDGTHVMGLVAYYQAPYVRNIGRRHARGARGGAARSRVVLVCSKWRACSQVGGRLYVCLCTLPTTLSISLLITYTSFPAFAQL